ncbi:ankyrin repeat and SOCS box protein 13-like isoform X1 [Daphnia pulicaria]|uniref:ankyrin repeat and SOCS box protein 13-like isoform X1 n=1 Tax=Daphnia pulicaria TaxID=35523 RepID=UPI001EEB088A|nr:ankyrin repeat and SOCS box protein 13-like isoform X1 [Daphnia pulicaria]
MQFQKSEMDRLLTEWHLNESLQNRHPMHYAAKKGNVEVMKALISRGYVVNCMTPTELVTPLHEASSKGNVAAVQFLIEEGAWINARNIDGATPLCVACAAGQTEVAKLLIESNASVNPTILIDPLNSPLHEAVMKGHIQCVKLLISKGAKLNAADRHYGTPLHAACVAYKINIDCILSLIQAGADVNATIVHKAPLHIAAYRNLFSVVQLLLNYGADVYMRDNLGKRPKELAKPNSAVKRLLHDYEINPRTLSDCCRLAILQSFVVGKNSMVIKQLGLPKKIIQFIFSC